MPRPPGSGSRPFGDCSLSDLERNRFSARAARYARVGANVGGVAARIAATRLMGGEQRSRPARSRARRRARRPQGPDHEGRPADGDHSRRAAAGIRRGARQAAERRAADGLGVRQAAHDGRARRRLAGAVRELRAPSRPPRPRSARCIARPRSTARRSPASCSIPDMQSAVEADLKQLEWLFAIHRRMDPAIDTTEMAERDRRPHSRRARLRARGEARRALPDDARGDAGGAGAARLAGALDPPPPHPRLARGRPAAPPQGATSSPPATGWRSPCSRRGGSRSAATA